MQPDKYYMITFMDNSTEDVYNYESKYIFTEEIKCITVKWDLPLIITYHSNNEENKTETYYYYSSLVFIKGSSLFTYPGYTWKGWSKQPDSETCDYKSSGSCIIDYDPDVGGTLDLYAIWEKDEE